MDRPDSLMSCDYTRDGEQDLNEDHHNTSDHPQVITSQHNAAAAKNRGYRGSNHNRR
jgi:hypothetical protein